MKKIGMFLITVLMTGYTFQLSFARVNFESALKEANDNFTYQSKPIHPGLVQQFMSRISDPAEPTTITVDVAAGHSNQYDDDEVVAKGKNICTKPDKDGESFCYEWLGKMANGIHVLSTGDSGGGSGDFEDLVFVQFTIGNGINLDGKKYKQLLMSVVREYALGDRYGGDIKVLPGMVLIKASTNGSNEQVLNKDVELKFPVQ
jgi:hypothetical protein